jgi:glycosyltransferase involved in cell wall biosynthesis
MTGESTEDSPLVSVWMVTYNHERYIRESLESVVSQKTNFTFEVIIGEDCSTDGTRSILKEFEEKYPEVVKPVYHQKNVGASRNAYEFCFPRLSGKYVACIEGDDYWSDPYKLQKQVDFLENNADYSICWTKYKNLEEGVLVIPSLQDQLFKPGFMLAAQNNYVTNIDLSNIFNPYVTHTLTAMFRRSALDYSLLSKLKYPKDNTLFCLCLSNGKGAILNFFSGIYRIHSGGTYTSLNLLKQRYTSFLNLEEIVSSIRGCNTDNLKFVRNHLLLESYALAISEKQKRNFKVKVLKKMLVYAPFKRKLGAIKNILKECFN